MERLTLKEVEALAERSGFTVLRTSVGTYRISELGTKRRLLNKNGTQDHMDAAEVYETLTERA